MTKNQAKPQEGDQLIQVNFKMPRRMHDQLQSAARSLCVDLSSLLRMILAEHAAEYVARADKASTGFKPAPKPPTRTTRTAPKPNDSGRYLDVKDDET